MAVNEFIATRKAADPTNAQQWQELWTLCEEKLWHQLTLGLLKITETEHFGTLTEAETVSFFNDFVASFEKHLSRLSLTELALRTSERIESHPDAVVFLQTFLDKIKDDVLATVLCKTHIAELELQQVHLAVALETLEKCVDDLKGIDTTHQRVHGALYRVMSDYYKTKGDFESYFSYSLRYLGCVDSKSIPNATARACDMVLAALLAEKIYSFGELLSLSVLDHLKGTNESWLVELVQAFSDGNIDAFEALAPKWSLVPDLANKQVDLKRKMCLLCLMEQIFRHPDADRRLPLSSIAQRTRLQLTEVEFLIMKALSLKLIEGAIDQVEGVLHVTWVRPRVLTKDQISVLATRIETWSHKVADTSNQIKM